MNVVKEPLRQPHGCAIVPGRGASSEPEGFVDCGNLTGVDPAIYLSFGGVRHVAQEFLGMVTPDAHEALRGELASALERVAELEGQVAEADRFAEAAEYTLNRFNTKVRRKPGRKPVEA